jgi:hypothetical protein
MGLSLSSKAFVEGGRIPRRHTCDGENLSPPLHWSGAPAGTQSFALICSDPDAPVGTWYHWAVFDIRRATDRLEEGFPGDSRIGGVRQAMTDFRRPGYGGPCPPKGHGDHRYRFHLLALDVAALAVPEAADCRAVEAAARRHVLAETVLTGTYSR